MRPTTILFLLSSFALVSCEAGRTSIGPFGRPMAASSEPPVPDTSGWDTGAVDSRAPLYGWDGSPVAGADPGGIERAPAASDRELDETGGSRFMMLELYERAVDERDGYLLEVEHQNRELELARQRYAELERRFAALSASHDALGAEKEAVEKQNRDLVGRLATAQIRRLEAEKAWLEAAIAQEREAAEASAHRDGEAR